MNFCVEFQPVPPCSFGQFGASQPFCASFFCHCSRRSLETWLVRLRRLSSATSGGMLAVIQSRTSFWKASSSALKDRRIDFLQNLSSRPERRRREVERPSFHHDRLTREEQAPPLRFAPVGVTEG